MAIIGVSSTTTVDHRTIWHDGVAENSAISFRRTFKVMLRSKGVSEEINNNYTGHKHGGSDQESYGGVYEDFVRQELNKMEHPWLNYKSK